jgi:hypothetical protein
MSERVQPISDQEFHKIMEENRERIHEITQKESEIRPKLIIATRDQKGTKKTACITIMFQTGSKEEKEMVLMAVGAKICMSLEIPDAVLLSAVAENQSSGETALLLAGQTIDGRTAITIAPLNHPWEGHTEIGNFEEIEYNKKLGGDMDLVRLVYAGFFQQSKVLHKQFQQKQLYERMADEPSLN